MFTPHFALVLTHLVNTVNCMFTFVVLNIKHKIGTIKMPIFTSIMAVKDS